MQEIIAYDPMTLSAADSDVAFEIYYVGSEDYADVAVAAGGDITLSHGATR